MLTEDDEGGRGADVARATSHPGDTRPLQSFGARKDSKEKLLSSVDAWGHDVLRTADAGAEDGKLTGGTESTRYNMGNMGGQLTGL